MGGLLNIFHSIILWFSNRLNRKRLRGARIEVMAFVVTRSPEPSILMALSAYRDRWQPPQEGVNLQESMTDALHRCLETECSLMLPTDSRAKERLMHIRSIKYIGTVELPTERHGERLVADDAPGTIFESVRLKRKAYWMATVILSSRSDIAPVADGKEVVDVRWMSFPDAEKAIRTSNRPEKTELLIEAISKCRDDLIGGQAT